MQEELELEEGLAVRIDLVYDQGWPQAVPGSPGWSTCPLIAVVSRPAAPESPTFVEDELLWGCTLASVVADGKDTHYQTHRPTSHPLPHPFRWMFCVLEVRTNLKPQRTTILIKHRVSNPRGVASATYNLQTLESIF